MKKDNKIKLRLLDDYESACNRIVDYWLKKQDFVDDETGDFYDWEWFRVGHSIDVCDYCISFEDIVLDIKKNVENGVYFEYYDHCLFYGMIGIKTPNYNSYLMGARAKPRTKVEHLLWRMGNKFKHCYWSLKNIKYWKERQELKRKGREFLEPYIKQDEGF